MGFKQITHNSIKDMQVNRVKTNAELTAENKQLREEIAALKGEYDAALIELAEMLEGGDKGG